MLLHGKLFKICVTLMLALGLVIAFNGVVLAFDSGDTPGTAGPNTIAWTGQGATNGDLNEKICPSAETLPQGIDPESYLHWIFTTDGGSALAGNLTLSGSGSGTYSVAKETRGTFHYYTPYYTPDASLKAEAAFDVIEPGSGAWILTISHGCPGPKPVDLTATKTATPSFTRTYEWKIEKHVAYDTVFFPAGTIPVATWEVVLEKLGYTDSDWAVNGVITVKNGNSFDVNGVNILDDGCVVTGGADLTVPAKGQVSANYECALDVNPGNGTNVAKVTWPDIGSANTSTTASAEYTFGAPTKVVNAEVDVTDTNGMSWHFTGSDTKTYVSTYPDDPPGTCTSHLNKATITQTGQSGKVWVMVCVGLDLKVSKTAVPAFTRTYGWDLSKVVNNTFVRKPGGTAVFDYNVNAWQTGFVDSAWSVSGEITVTNPNDWETITLTGLTDTIDNGGDCVIAEAGPYIVPASGNLKVTYTCSYPAAPDWAAGKNTASVTWNGDQAATPSSWASGWADFAFVVPTTVINQTVTITDTMVGLLGTLTASDMIPYTTGQYLYSKTVSVPEWGCSAYDNTASIIETGQKASASVQVCGRIKTGALTMGFWQNKNGQDLIKTSASSAGICVVGVWLRQYAPFQDLNSAASCSQVATYVTNVIKAANASGSSMNAMLKAQMLATALDVFFSDAGLGGNRIGAPAPIGGVVIDLTAIYTDLSFSAFEDASPAFGGAKSMTVGQMLTFAASQSAVGGSLWYGNDKNIQELAKDAFDAINNQAVFAP